jgi:superfamily II DNA or RNA helicase
VSRFFSARQRQILAFVARGRCRNCGAALAATFDADHVRPWSKGGATTTKNGAALCASCNRRKGSKMTQAFTPREWQQRCHSKAIAWLTDKKADNRHYLINASPGAGKTMMGAWLASTLIDRDLVERVIVIAPRTEIVRSWAADFLALTGRHMMKITSSTAAHITGHQPDLCATWAAITGLLPEMQAICRDANTLVICDEHHHAALAAAWGASADSAFTEARFVVAMTGTPLRSDGNGMVWFGTDEKTGALSIAEGGSFTLTYREAIDAGYCRPMTFHRHPGRFKIKLNGGKAAIVEADSFTPPKGADLDATMLRLCAYDKLVRRPQWTKVGEPVRNSYHASMIEHAGRKLDLLRDHPLAEGGLPNAGGLVIAPTIEMADYFGRLIEMIEDKPPLVVHSGVPNAEDLIALFRRGKHRWLVSVNMVSEGVDVPRIRVIVNLSSAETELYFRQAAGRAIRSAGPDDCSRAYMVMPELGAFREWARNYENEQGPTPPKRKRAPRADGADTWTCEHCDALNPKGATHCHACGEPRLPDAIKPAFEFTIAEATGWREGVITRGVDLTEQETKGGEDLARLLRQVERKQPGSTMALLAQFTPEMFGKIKVVFDLLTEEMAAKAAVLGRTIVDFRLPITLVIN